MSEFQLTHVALIGARMALFQSHGFRSRVEMSMRRIPPVHDLTGLDESEAKRAISAELPLWVHNIITDPDFPGRRELLMPIRRFEGELRDNRDNEVISAVLSAGFKNHNLDPLDLPRTMPLRQRCALVMHIGAWQDAYRRLENDLGLMLAAQSAAVVAWVTSAREPGNEHVEDGVAEVS